MSKFNENLLGFVKKQYPEDIMQNYEELYNLYANNQIKFCSPVHTLEDHLETILEEVFENAFKIKQLKHKISGNIEEDDKIYKMISKIILEDAELLKHELDQARKELQCNKSQDQIKIQNLHAESGKFGSNDKLDIGGNWEPNEEVEKFLKEEEK